MQKTLQKLSVLSVAVGAFIATRKPVMAAAAAADDIFGTIEAPQGVAEYNDGAAQNFGAIIFFSNLLKLATTVAGIWVMANFIMAGYIYITSAGDTGAHKKVTDKLTMSIVGLILIVSAYTVAGLIGLIIFDDASYILNPTITGA